VHRGLTHRRRCGIRAKVQEKRGFDKGRHRRSAWSQVVENAGATKVAVGKGSARQSPGTRYIRTVIVKVQVLRISSVCDRHTVYNIYVTARPGRTMTPCTEQFYPKRRHGVKSLSRAILFFDEVQICLSVFPLPGRRRPLQRNLRESG
jgi:hypothetical protein